MELSLHPNSICDTPNTTTTTTLSKNDHHKNATFTHIFFRSRGFLGALCIVTMSFRHPAFIIPTFHINSEPQFPWVTSSRSHKATVRTGIQSQAAQLQSLSSHPPTIYIGHIHSVSGTTFALPSHT